MTDSRQGSVLSKGLLHRIVGSGYRERQVFKALVASAGSMLVQAGFTLGALPVAKAAIGTEFFAAYGTLIVVMTWLSTANIAVGPYLPLQIPDAVIARSDSRLVRVISAAFATVSGLAVLIVSLFALAPVRDFTAGLIVSEGASSAVRGSVADALFVVAVAAALGALLTVSDSIRLGLQERHVATLWASAGMAIAIGCVLWSAWAGSGLVGLVWAALVAPLVGRAANAVLLWGSSRPHLRPRLRSVSKADVLQVLRTNGLYTIVQAASLLGTPLALVLVSNYESAAVAAGFFVLVLLAQLVGTVVAALLTPMMPALRHAHSSGEIRWVWGGVRVVLALAFAAGLALLGFLVVGGPIIGLLFGADAILTLPVRLSMGVYFCLLILESALYTVGLVFLSHRRLAAVMISRGVVTLTLLLVLTPLHGVAGAAAGLVIGIVATSTWIYAVMFVRLGGRLRRGKVKPGQL